MTTLAPRTPCHCSRLGEPAPSIGLAGHHLYYGYERKRDCCGGGGPADTAESLTRSLERLAATPGDSRDGKPNPLKWVTVSCCCGWAATVRGAKAASTALELVEPALAHVHRVRAAKAYTKPADTVMCLHCGAAVEQHPDGRPRLYCSARCRVAAHRAGKRAEKLAAAAAAAASSSTTCGAVSRSGLVCDQTPHDELEPHSGVQGTHRRNFVIAATPGRALEPVVELPELIEAEHPAESDAFTTRPATLGPQHIDVRCNVHGCSWHKVIHAPSGGGRALGDLREHARSHRVTPPEPAPARRRVALIACSSTKLDHAAPADELYTSALFRKSVKWAENVAQVDAWYVLSAKHGLVAPSTVLEPYDEKLAGDRPEWAEDVLEALAEEFGEELAEVEFTVLAGGAYERNLRTLETGTGRVLLRIEFPLAGMQIGERLAWLPKL